MAWTYVLAALSLVVLGTIFGMVTGRWDGYDHLKTLVLFLLGTGPTIFMVRRSGGIRAALSRTMKG